MIKNEPEIDKT